MACGGCRKKALALIESLKPLPPPEPEPLIRCPACNALHTEREFQECPFRLQQEKQKAREARIKALQPTNVVAQEPLNTRRGGVPANTTVVTQRDRDTRSQKKW